MRTHIKYLCHGVSVKLALAAAVAACLSTTANAHLSISLDCVLPPRDCAGTTAHCTELVPFEPVEGLGYENYPINGETPANQHRSYTRRDLMMLVKHAAAVVECKASGWMPGNRKPIGLGDMSEADGRTPGSAAGRPGHPRGTHVNGRDMDIAYFQTANPNNRLRAVCPHLDSRRRDVKHCTGAPTILDVRRTALFIGTLLTSDRTRVIGVDGRIEPLVEPAIRSLCTDGTLETIACTRLSKLPSETRDTGQGWYRHHHHHLHIAFKKISGAGLVPTQTDNDHSISPGRRDIGRDVRELEASGAEGHVISDD